MCEIGAIPNAEFIEKSFLPLVEHMTRGDWVSSRAAACGLFGSLYANVDGSIKAELRELRLPRPQSCIAVLLRGSSVLRLPLHH